MSHKQVLFSPAARERSCLAPPPWRNRSPTAPAGLALILSSWVPMDPVVWSECCWAASPTR
jgi:hypothetical protein